MHHHVFLDALAGDGIDGCADLALFLQPAEVDENARGVVFTGQHGGGVTSAFEISSSAAMPVALVRPSPRACRNRSMVVNVFHDTPMRPSSPGFLKRHSNDGHCSAVEFRFFTNRATNRAPCSPSPRSLASSNRTIQKAASSRRDVPRIRPLRPACMLPKKLDKLFRHTGDRVRLFQVVFLLFARLGLQRVRIKPLKQPANARFTWDFLYPN